MASTDQGRIAIVAESTFGTTPTNPTLLIKRITSSSFQYTKNYSESNELDPNALGGGYTEVSAASGGSINIELSPASHDDLFEAVVRGTRSTAIAVTAGSAAIVASTGTVTDTGSFANAEIGQWLLFTGWDKSGNNGWKKILTNADNDTITVATTGLEDETSGGAIRGSTIRSGVVERSFSVEETYTDIDIARLFKGQRVGSYSGDMTPGNPLTGTFNFQGTQVSIEDGSPFSWLGTGSRTGSNTNDVMNATSSFGGIYIDGTLSTSCFKSNSINIDVGLTPSECLGNKFPNAISYGTQTVTGTLTKLFDSATLYQAVLDHSSIGLAFGAYNTQGGIHFEAPQVKLLTDGVSLTGGKNSDVEEPIDWGAERYYDSTLAVYYKIRVDVAGS